MAKQPMRRFSRRHFFSGWPPPRAVTLILGILNFIALANPLAASVLAWALSVLSVLIVSAIAMRVTIDVLRR